MAEETTAPAAPKNEAAAGNPLHKKLGIRAQMKGLVIEPPQDDDNPLLPLPDGFSVLDELKGLATAAGPFDYIHVFARDRADLVAAFDELRNRLAPGGSLWISWMKQSSRGRGLLGDLNENVVRRLALTHALVDVKVAALDRHWSALKLVHRRH